MQGKLTADMIKCDIRLVCINALMGFINHKNIPLCIFDLFQLVILSTKIQ